MSYCYLTANEPFGLILFPFGLLAICVYGYGLFTGAIGFSNDWKDLALMLLENFIGVILVGSLLRICDSEICDISNKVIDKKFEIEWFRIFLKGVFCGICMYFAVKPWKAKQGIFVRVLSVFGFVCLFLVCKFEHGIADFAYCVMAGKIDIAKIMLILAGNGAGSKIMRLFDSAN